MRKVGMWENEEKIKEELGKLKTKTEKLENIKKNLHLQIVFKIDLNYKELLLFSSKEKVFDIKLQERHK